MEATAGWAEARVPRRSTWRRAGSGPSSGGTSVTRGASSGAPPPAGLPEVDVGALAAEALEHFKAAGDLDLSIRRLRPESVARVVAVAKARALSAREGVQGSTSVAQASVQLQTLVASVAAAASATPAALRGAEPLDAQGVEADPDGRCDAAENALAPLRLCAALLRHRSGDSAQRQLAAAATLGAAAAAE